MKIVPCGVHHLELRKGRICTSDVPEISAYAEKTWLDWVEIPCGKCEGCRIARSRDWANRCMMELEYHDSAYFLTLTYDEEHVPQSRYAESGDRRGDAVSQFGEASYAAFLEASSESLPG